MPNPTAAMLVIGDEILSGRTRDANMHHLAGALTAQGIDLKEVRVVGDEADVIVATVQALAKTYDHLFTSGGIGPTHDDITADCIAAAFGRHIDVRADARALVAEFYANSGRELNEARLRMARIPDGADLIDNPVSAAPGFTLSVQWHPEWNADNDPVSRPLFSAFGDAVQAWAEARDITMNPSTKLFYVEVQEPDMHDPTGDLERLVQALRDQWDLPELEVVARLKTYDKIARSIVGLELQTAGDLPPTGTALFREGRAVGTAPLEALRGGRLARALRHRSQCPPERLADLCLAAGNPLGAEAGNPLGAGS